ncbi:hypothetical protein [Paenibacillus humicus]|uniref:hypothetical protein n=1 Tax=Paenibacillus humicus TaxID=412861 RepID=UPI000FD946FC|nr:hypothetical protein [Paenibacillus humicus]
MALILSVKLNSGIQVENAYVRAASINGTAQELEVKVLYYANKENRTEGKPPFQVRTFRFVPSVAPGSANYHRQFYEWAKTTDEFAHATDDLEDGN